MGNLRVERLAGHHDRAAFNCEDGDLGTYLRDAAGQDMRRYATAVFVAITSSHPRTIVGYYTLSSFSLNLNDIPPAQRRKLARYPDVGTTLLGRLAVDARCRGQGLGEFLLVDALQRAAAAEIATAGVVVDALESAEGFYTRYGFVRLSGQRFWIPMPTIQRLFPPEVVAEADGEAPTAEAPA